MPGETKQKIPTTPKKSRAFERKYISPLELAARWSVSGSAIYHGRCEANALTVVRFGRSIRFIRAEVEAFEKAREAEGKGKEFA
jgi:hypothetical protein